MALWRVTVVEHAVAPRWTVPARETVVGAETAADARLTVLRWAHSDAGVPPLRSLLRVSWPSSRAERYVDAREEERSKMLSAGRGTAGR